MIIAIAFVCRGAGDTIERHILFFIIITRLLSLTHSLTYIHTYARALSLTHTRTRTRTLTNTNTHSLPYFPFHACFFLSFSGDGGLNQSDVASVVSGMCSSILRDSLIESRLAGNMHMNADSQNPFAVLLRTTHPKHVFTEQPKPFVTPVTLSGLGGDLASLNNVYTYDSMIAGRPCYKELKAVEDAAAVLHYIYWWPEFTRWYVGPTPGSSNILVYVDGVAGGDGVPDQRNGLWTAWNGADWLKMKDVNCISLNTKIFKAAPKPSAIEMDTST